MTIQPERHFAPNRFQDVVESLQERLTEIDLKYDCERRLLITILRFRDRPCFSFQLLREYRTLCEVLFDTMAGISFEERPVRFLLHTSSQRGVWCFGGDLELFICCIQQGDRSTLRDYGYECLHAGHISHIGLGLSVVTMCLVQGVAMGGGFESARSCNFLFAEKQSTFGLPEMNFNMFAGMGAYTYLAERIGLHRVEEMMLDAKVRTADEMHRMGAVDYIAGEGNGIHVVRAFVDKHGKKFAGLAGMLEARRLSMRIDLHAMHRVVDAWVDCAFRTNSADHQMMERLINAQRRYR